MKSKIIEHILSLIFIFILFIAIYITFLRPETTISTGVIQNSGKVEKIDFINPNNPMQMILLKETIQAFYHEKSDSVFNRYEFEQVLESGKGQSGDQQISWEIGKNLAVMYLKFIGVFILVMALTYYGVQTFGVLRFVLNKQNKPPILSRIFRIIKNTTHKNKAKEKLKDYLKSASLFGIAILKSLAYLILFSPAYVIAYSFKTKFDTDSTIFMILLGVISNGLLITYTQKFYTFLVTESRKGYVETAMVKNLVNDYSFKTLQFPSIIAIRKKFPGHVFDHIFINARYQYLNTIKEQAAFLISGLIIIEMALNIHNHLSYELLQNLLYENYMVVLIILFVIYLTVKATEVFVDILLFRENKKYSND